jgi:hypothetical protein
MEIESLWPKNHTISPLLRMMLTSSTHINYCWLRNRWRKLRPSCTKNNPRNPVLRLALKTSMDIDYCWLKNHWQKLSPYGPKHHPRSPVLRPNAEIFNGHRLLLTHKPLLKIESLGPKNHPSPLLRLTLTSSMHIDYCSLRNHWRKLRPCCTINNPRTQFTPDAEIFRAHKILLI